MKLYKVRDVIRENVGRDRMAEHMLDWCVERALREIEKSKNWYWMEATKTFDLVVDQGDYSVYTSTSGGLLIPNYKDVRILLAQDEGSSEWDEVVGPEDITMLKTSFADDDEGFPEAWSLAESTSDATLQVWPPNPDQTYAMTLLYYQWTSLPTDPTSEAHEVLKRWPEALIYLACEQAMVNVAKDLGAASYWRSLYDNPGNANTEFNKMNRYDQDRAQALRGDLYPRTGGKVGRSRYQQGYRF